MQEGLTDTPPEIAEMVRARIMALGGVERFLMGVRMFEAARRMALSSFPTDLSEPERKRLLFERFYGEPPPPHFCSMKLTENVRKSAAEQTISEEETSQKGMEKKAAEFVKNGVESYAKA